jgi:hypothetical protein
VKVNKPWNNLIPWTEVGVTAASDETKVTYKMGDVDSGTAVDECLDTSSVEVQASEKMEPSTTGPSLADQAARFQRRLIAVKVVDDGLDKFDGKGWAGSGHDDSMRSCRFKWTGDFRWS